MATPLSLLLSFSLFPIFLSADVGIGIGVSVFCFGVWGFWFGFGFFSVCVRLRNIVHRAVVAGCIRRLQVAYLKRRLVRCSRLFEKVPNR